VIFFDGEQDIPAVHAWSGLSAVALTAGLAAGGPSGALHHGRGEEARSGDAVPAIRRRSAWVPAVPPADDGGAAALRVLRGRAVVAEDRKEDARGHAFRVIAGGAQPDHSSISEFRRVHLNPLAELFVQVLRLCQAAGMMKLGHVSLDGTKVKANASKHKAMSYERMQKDEQRLREKVGGLLKAAAAADAEEDKAHGKHERGEGRGSSEKRGATMFNDSYLVVTALVCSDAG
jgi:hypothetical protein